MTWATELWPFVNGKALMSGLNLREMEASDMLDVVHFLFEEDSHYVSEESAKSRSNVRVALYKEMYKRPYIFEYKDGQGTAGQQSGAPYAYSYEGTASDTSYMSDEESAKPFDPLAERKPELQPRTEFDPMAANPFQGVLDAPFEH